MVSRWSFTRIKYKGALQTVYSLWLSDTRFLQEGGRDRQHISTRQHRSFARPCGGGISKASRLVIR